MLAFACALGLATASPEPLVQDPVAHAAVAVRGDTELSPAAAYASARTRVADHVRTVWQERAETAVARQRPFWLPEVIADAAVQRWLATLPTEQLVRTVDREDREREHEFGTSIQTTLWVAEEPRAVARSERSLQSLLAGLERRTAGKFGITALTWVLLVVLLGWIDRLSRGYMTGRLTLAGLLAAVATPAVLFLV